MARIMLIDDEELALRMQYSVLEALGHDTVCCRCAESALNLLAEGEHVDLVITDINMPGMGGRVFIERMLKHQAYHNIPMIVLSADNSVNRVANILGLGDITFLGKPIRMLALKAAIKNALVSRELRAMRAKQMNIPEPTGRTEHE